MGQLVSIEERNNRQEKKRIFYLGLVPSQKFPSNSLYVTIIHHTMTEHKNNHVTMSFTMIMSQFAGPFYQLWTHRKDYLRLPEHTNHRASLN